MDGQAIAVIHAMFHLDHTAELSHTAADKDLAQKPFSTRGHQINADILASHIHISHTDLDAALVFPIFDLGEAYIFPFCPAFIGVYVRNQSPIICHIVSPSFFGFCRCFTFPTSKICYHFCIIRNFSFRKSPSVNGNNNYFYFMYLSIESMQKKCYPVFRRILKFFSFLEVLA